MSEEKFSRDEEMIVEAVGDGRVRVTFPVPKLGKYVYLIKEGVSQEEALRRVHEAVVKRNEERWARIQPLL